MISVIDHSAIQHVQTGQIEYDAGSTLGPRTQSGLQIVMLDRGSVRITTNADTKILRPGAMVIQRPGGRELFQFDAEEQSSHRWIAFLPKSRASTCWIGDLSSLEAKEPIETPVMSRVFELVHRGSTPNATKLSSSPASIMLAVAYLTAMIEQVDIGAVTTPAPRLPTPLQRMATFIESHSSEPVTLKTLAEAAGVTPSYLIRLCRKHGLPTPIRQLWDMRISKADQLLKSTGLTVNEIAFRVGFSNPYHFSRMYKQSTGITPTRSRHIAWND